MYPDAIAAYYDDLVDRYGHDPRAVDASSQESLERRYEVLSEVCDLNGKSVLEVGCGFGDLGAYLRARFDGIDYYGIDLSQRMIEEGRRVYPDMNIHQGNLFDENVTDQVQGADVVLAQGIFYLLGEKVEERSRAIVTRMFSLAGEAVAFTTLSTWGPTQETGEFYMNPIFALELGHSLTDKVVLRHDYHPGDLAMYLYR